MNKEEKWRQDAAYLKWFQVNSYNNGYTDGYDKGFKQGFVVGIIIPIVICLGFLIAKYFIK